LWRDPHFRIPNRNHRRDEKLVVHAIIDVRVPDVSAKVRPTNDLFSINLI
jgi:hypothetical protein